jgi:CheY-like chemotaxis protein
MSETEEKKILIVDDQPENLEAIADCFTNYKLDYSVLRAPNGSIAYELAEIRLPDLIITDWDMPEMNGIELIKELKSNTVTKDIPVIMCTGVMTTSENLRTAINAGAVDFIRKPIDEIELVARVHSMLCLSDSFKQLAVEKQKVEKLFIESELAFLRSQVSPHFLMNTLNNIHALIDYDSEEAKNSIIILSRLMRHLLYESESVANPISMEMDFIRNYVDLMRLRFAEKAEIKLDIQDTMPSKSIPPLLFTSLLDNAFKHGIAANNGSFIHINISCANSKLIFEIKNGIPNHTKSNAPSGIGIENTRKRINLLYGENCELHISDNDDIFIARLTVPF